MTTAKFFDAMRRGLLGPTLSQSEVSGCNAIIDAMQGLPLSYTAYALATAYKETARTMQPIDERGGPSYFAKYDNDPADLWAAAAAPRIAGGNGQHALTPRPHLRKEIR